MVSLINARPTTREGRRQVGRMPDPLSLDEHRTLGRELYEMREKLMTSALMVANHYGVSKMPGKRLLAAVDRLDKARSEMDAQLERDRPDDWCAYVYYPGSNDDQEHHRLVGCNTCYPDHK